MQVNTTFINCGGCYFVLGGGGFQWLSFVVVPVYWLKVYEHDCTFATDCVRES